MTNIFLFFSNLGKGEGERENNALSIIHKSSCDDLQSVYFISKLFLITREDLRYFYISPVDGCLQLHPQYVPKSVLALKGQNMILVGFSTNYFLKRYFPNQKKATFFFSV